jgi:hypothetical protein
MDDFDDARPPAPKRAGLRPARFACCCRVLPAQCHPGASKAGPFLPRSGSVRYSRRYATPSGRPLRRRGPGHCAHRTRQALLRAAPPRPSLEEAMMSTGPLTPTRLSSWCPTTTPLLPSCMACAAGSSLSVQSAGRGGSPRRCAVTVSTRGSSRRPAACSSADAVAAPTDCLQVVCRAPTIPAESPPGP